MCLHLVRQSDPHPLQALDPVVDLVQLLAEVPRAVLHVAVEEVPDPVQGEAELAVHQDVAQPVEVGHGVRPVPRQRATTGHHEPDGVVVVQRPDRRAEQLRRRAHRPLLLHRRSPHGHERGA